jgi:hypothetical protein
MEFGKGGIDIAVDFRSLGRVVRPGDGCNAGNETGNADQDHSGWK